MLDLNKKDNEIVDGDREDEDSLELNRVGKEVR